MNALLKLGSLSDQSHSCPGKLPFIPEITRWDPYRGKGSCSLELVQTSGIELICLVSHAQHEFSLGSMHQSRNATRLFDLVHDPVSVPYGLHGYWASWVALFFEERSQSPRS